MAQATQGNDIYYVPHGSKWPIVGSIGLFMTMIGAATWLNEMAIGRPLFFAGIAMLIFMLFGWFGTVIAESIKGAYNKQVDTSFRMGMMWFIFSEVMFFAAFFGALFYARALSVPWIGGEGDGARPIFTCGRISRRPGRPTARRRSAAASRPSRPGACPSSIR